MLLYDAIRLIETKLSNALLGLEVYRSTAVIQSDSNKAIVSYGVLDDGTPFMGSEIRRIIGYYLIELSYKEDTDLSAIENTANNIILTIQQYSAGDMFVTGAELETIESSGYPKRLVQPITIYFLIQN